MSCSFGWSLLFTYYNYIYKNARNEYRMTQRVHFILIVILGKITEQKNDNTVKQRNNAAKYKVIKIIFVPRVTVKNVLE